MDRKRLPKSICKYVRKGKARIRRDFLDSKEQENKIKELYKRLAIKRDIEYSQRNEVKIKKRKKNISKPDHGKNEIS